MAAISASRNLFRDDFNTNGPISAATWNYQTGDAANYGATHARDSLPVAQGGNAVLQVDSYNPRAAGATFLGSAAFTTQFFGFQTSNAPGGIAFETRAALNPKDASGNTVNSSGVIGGFFPYVYLPATGLHDEIDFEWIPKRSIDPSFPGGNNDPLHPNLTQTNAYANDPFGDGIFKTHPMPNNGVITDFHTYRIEWMPGQIRWLVDGVLLRTEKTHVPTHDMQLFMNIWVGEQNWPSSDWANLSPTANSGQNQTRQFLLDYVSVEALSAQIGSRRAERMEGTAQNDHLRALGGDDEVLGLAGDDVLIGGGGSDSLDGGSGNDTIRAGDDGSTLPTVSTLIAVTGDELYGEEGDDLLIGGAGRDLLFGGTGDDRLSGGDGSDTLDGGEGTDRMTGGDGADSFRFGDAAESPRRAGDTITDFDSAEGDVIDLSAIDTDAVAPGHQGFAFLGNAAFGGTRARPGEAELRWEAKGAGVIILADFDGDGRADMEIMLRGVSSLVAEDFIL